MPNTMQDPHYIDGMSIVLDEEIIDEGGETDFFSVEWDEPRNSYKNAVNGSLGRSKHNSKAGKISLTIFRTDTPTDQKLYELGEAEPPDDEFDFSISDPATGKSLTATQCTVENRPSREFGKDLSELTYEIKSPNITVEFT